MAPAQQTTDLCLLMATTVSITRPRATHSQAPEGVVDESWVGGLEVGQNLDVKFGMSDSDPATADCCP